MKILCVSDTVDSLVDSLGIRERFGDVSLVLGAGDLPLDYLSYIVSALDRPVLFVFGNHHTEELASYRDGANMDHRHPHDYSLDRGIIHVGRKPVREAGLIVMGFGGSARYNGGPNQFTQAEMWARVLAAAPRLLWNRLFLGRAVDIVLAHAPPRGVGDGADPCHRGFDAFLWLMRVWKPRYFVHGHVHLYGLGDRRVARYRDTTVVNACGHYVIDTEAPYA